MPNSDQKYELVIRPGVSGDGTYALFAVPIQKPEIEYLLDGQFDTISEAKETAGLYLEYFESRLASTDIEIKDARKLELPKLTEGLSEAALVSTTEELLKNTMPKKGQTSLTKNALAMRVARSNDFPYLMCYAAFIVYGFTVSFSVPEWFPIFGEWLKDWRFTPVSLAEAFPYLLLVAALYTTIRTVHQGMRFALLGDCVLALALQHRWKLQDFDQLSRKVLLTSATPLMATLVKFFLRLSESSTELFGTGNHVVDEGKFQREEFENRIHTIYYLRKEVGYDRYVFAFSPFYFLLGKDRLVVRTQLGERPIFGLPNGRKLTSIVVCPFNCRVGHIPLSGLTTLPG